MPNETDVATEDTAAVAETSPTDTTDTTDTTDAVAPSRAASEGAAVAEASPQEPPRQLVVQPAPWSGGLAVGRIVHYRLPDGQNAGQDRPAIIVRVWSYETGMVNLQVFTDGPNDGEAFRSGLYWATSVPYAADESTRHTWHWPTLVSVSTPTIASQLEKTEKTEA